MASVSRSRRSCTQLLPGDDAERQRHAAAPPRASRTSSRTIDDEGVLDGDARLAAARGWRSRAARATSRTSGLGIGAVARGHAQHRAVVRHLLDARLRAAQRRGGLGRARSTSSSATRRVARRSTISRGRADVEQRAAEDERQPVAALRLVHVVRREQHGRALGGEAVDLVPELAPAHRIDAGGRLVEEQQRRLVDRRAGERDPLLPAARQRAGELVAAIAEPRRASTSSTRARRARARHAVDARRRSAGSRTTVRSSYRLNRWVM